MSDLGRGPYLNDDGDIWLPTDAWSWNDAQSEAKQMADESDSDAHYEGKVVASLHDHDGWEEGGCEDCQREAYHFRAIWRYSDD